jgi:hypothetical protein
VPITPNVPRDSTADIRTRRALDLLSAQLNALLQAEELVQTGPGGFQLNPSTEQLILSGRVFAFVPKYGMWGG